MYKKGISIILCLLLFTGSASAEFLQQAAAWDDAYQNGTAIHACVTAEVNALPYISGDTLSFVKGLVRDSSCGITVQSGQESSFGELKLGISDSTFFHVITAEKDARSYLLFPEDELRAVWDVNEEKALQDVSLQAMSMPDVKSAFFLLIRGFEDFAALLAKDETVKVKNASSETKIKYIGTSPKCVSYTVSGEGMETFSEVLIRCISPGVHAFLVDDARADDLLSYIGALTYPSDFRLKNLLARDGTSLGWQVTCQTAAEGETARKVTFTIAFAADKALYIALQAPAVKGKDTLTMACGWTIKHNKSDIRLEGAYDLSLKTGSDSRTRNISFALKNVPEDGSDHVTGKVTYSEKTGGLKRTGEIKVTLDADEDSISVSLPVIIKDNEKTMLDADIGILIEKDSDFDVSGYLVPDASDVSDEERDIDRVMMLERQFLFARFLGLIDTCPDDIAFQIAHALRTQDWMTAPNVAVPSVWEDLGSQDDPDDWTVKEE